MKKKYSRKKNEEIDQELRLEATGRNFDSRGNVHGQATADICSKYIQDVSTHKDQNHSTFFPAVSDPVHRALPLYKASTAIHISTTRQSETFPLMI